jgi:hypothetical protein
VVESRLEEEKADLCLMVIEIIMSLRALRGNLIKKDIFISLIDFILLYGIATLRMQREFNHMGLPRCDRNDIIKMLPNH